MGFSEIFTYTYLKETKYYEIMKYKKELSVLLIFLTFAWPVFDILDPSYTPTQVILTVIFAYLGMRLTYFVYSKNK